ncbi:MAG TPA: hypothetical protein VHP14_26045 [Anaerolineales bacterium]|nr:hypothetical protein [Anaerolineales bacterium]
MEKRRTKSVLSVLLMIFLAACNYPATPPIVGAQTTPTEPPATSATETGTTTEVPATVEGNAPMTGTGVCANNYYPVRQGATWSYKSTGAGDYSFTDTITSVREDGFTLSTQSGNLAGTQEWACKPEGLVALQFGGAPAALLSAQSMQLNVQSSNVSGITFPSQINAGNTWQHSLDLQGNASAAGIEGEAKGTAQNNFTAVGTESVTVPAGTFEAMKIQADTTINMTVSYNGLPIPIKFSSSYTYWFAPGVGWVKASGTGSIAGTSYSETTELQSYNIP